MARQNEKSDLWTVISVMELNPNCLRGKSFSITGHLGLPRAEVVKIIESCGGHFEETPKWGVQFLVTERDWNKGSTAEPKCSLKLRKALDMRIKVISENELVKMIVDGDAALVEKSA